MAGPLSSSDIDLREYIRVLRQRKWVVLGTMLAIGALALLFSILRTPVYTSTAKVLIQRPSPAVDPNNTQRINSDLLAEIELQFYEGDAVKAAAQDKLGYKAQAPASATARGSVMQITASNTDAQKAADTANRFAEAYIETRRKSTVDDYAATAQATQTKINDIDGRLAALDSQATASTSTTVAPFPGAKVPGSTTTSLGTASERAERDSLSAQKQALEKTLSNLQVGQENAAASGPQIVSPAKVADSPSSPNVKRDTLLGFLAGLILGVAAAFVVDFLDDSIKNRQELETATDSSPILAIIPYYTDWRDRNEAHLASIEKPSSPTAEAYRGLRTAIQFAGLESPIKALQVTSPRAQDGKTTASTNLAVALARAGMRVVLIDCDLRRPRVHEFLGLANDRGFTSILLGDIAPEDALQKVESVPYLRFMASGPVPPNPSELLAGRRAGELIASLKDAADIVVLDTPPVLPVSDALVVSDLMDAVIMVITAGATTKSETHRAFELLRQVEAPLIGTVMNTAAGQSPYTSRYGYSYSSRTARPSIGAWTRRATREPRPDNGVPGGVVGESPVAHRAHGAPPAADNPDSLDADGVVTSSPASSGTGPA